MSCFLYFNVVVRCIGTQGENDFIFDASVNYCSSKPTLDFTLNPEGQKSRKFNFKNGSNQFLGHQLTVDMKKEGNSILTNVSHAQLSFVTAVDLGIDLFFIIFIICVYFVSLVSFSHYRQLQLTYYLIKLPSKLFCSIFSSIVFERTSRLLSNKLTCKNKTSFEQRLHQLRFLS